MTIQSYAHELAARLPAMAQDSSLNNATMIAGEVADLFRRSGQVHAVFTTTTGERSIPWDHIDCLKHGQLNVEVCLLDGRTFTASPAGVRLRLVNAG